MDEKTFTEVTAGESEAQYIKPKDLTTLEGIFLGVQQSQYGPSYKIENENGDLLIVNGSGALDAKMSKVTEGSFVRLENLGMKPITKGKFAGKSFHDIKVSVAE